MSMLAATSVSDKKQQQSLEKKTIRLMGIDFIIDPEYTLTKVVGKGIYGVVATGTNSITNQSIAIKRINDLFRNLGDSKRVLRQIKILKFLKHKNIVPLLDMIRIDNPESFNDIYLCMQSMQFNLHQLIHSKYPINQKMIKAIMFQILNGIYYMHSAKIIHRDLKPQNILLNKKCQLKIADMNLARKQNQSDKTDYVASRPYRAPQIFISSSAYTNAIDIWSAGCILAELLGRTVLFQGRDFIDQMKRFVAILGKPKMQLFHDIDSTTRQAITRLLADVPDRTKIDWRYLFPKADDLALDLLDKMLIYDSNTRYTAQQCLDHPYLKQFASIQRQPCSQIFDFSFDNIEMKTQALRKAIYQESVYFQELKRIKYQQLQKKKENLVQNQLINKNEQKVPESKTQQNISSKRSREEQEKQVQGMQGTKKIKTQ